MLHLVPFVFVVDIISQGHMNVCWWIRGHCLLGQLTVPIDMHNESEAFHWFTPLNFHGCYKWEISGGIYDSGFASIRRAFLPWIRVNTNDCKIRNLSLTLGEQADSSAKAIKTQQWSLHSLATVILDNCITLDYLVAEQGDIVQQGNHLSHMDKYSGEVNI